MEFDYDYIICGGGASGLSLASRLSLDNFFSGKKILIIDPEYPKKINDRTWCFWENNDNIIWKDLTFYNWNNIIFKSDNFNKVISLKPLSYKMLKSVSYYNYTNNIISKNSNIKNQLCQQEST